ncbi:RNA polymerase sigma factor [Hyphobacterium marinum]|uniref:RNA polymerase sigma factor n=1 Tax=Hyphobacterium marinum TaxID=3116574 RepID=A0ABU7LU49_9PROT|nr:RNA polymerase sigma factor [Hyphobacterium sp. Y6023]MEE2565083.1 RNA polymerase sigma factor [Hyphobacterium sp. Y6023]
MTVRKSRSVPDYETLEEAELVDHARDGDLEAFRVIMQRCNQRLFRVVRAILGVDADAEDALQDVYVKAFTKLHTFRGDAGILTWLTRIAINEARGRLRKRRADVSLDVLEQSQQTDATILMFPGGSMATPEENAARSEMRTLVESAIDDLPEPFRVVFVLRDVEGCSVAETAAAQGLKEETVKTRLYRARRRLRETLDKQVSHAVDDAFPFLGHRCDRITNAVIERLAAARPARD